MLKVNTVLEQCLILTIILPVLEIIHLLIEINMELKDMLEIIIMLIIIIKERLKLLVRVTLKFRVLTPMIQVLLI